MYYALPGQRIDNRLWVFTPPVCFSALHSSRASIAAVVRVEARPGAETLILG